MHLTKPKSIPNGKSRQQIVLFNTPKANSTDDCHLNCQLIGRHAVTLQNITCNDCKDNV